jgi:hypothetical protein
MISWMALSGVRSALCDERSRRASTALAVRLVPLSAGYSSHVYQKTAAGLQLKKQETIPAFTFTSEPIDLAALLFSRAGSVEYIA